MIKNRKKILLQFKDEVLRDSIVGMISKEINDLDILNDPEKKLEQFSNSENIDLIISEYDRQHSWEITSFIEQTKKIDTKIPFILIGPQISPLAIKRCIKNGASNYIPIHQLLQLPSILKKVLFKNKSKKQSSYLLDKGYDMETLIKLEESLAIKNQHLEALITLKNQDIEAFTHTAAHDLQEPLRMIISYLQLLRQHASKNFTAEHLEFLNYAEDGANRMNQLLMNLLAFSKSSSIGPSLETININDILHEVTQDLSLVIRQSQAIIQINQVPNIVANQSQIRQVFQNLITNGIKFQKENQFPLIEITGKEEQDEYIFSVQDNGIGIEAEFQGEIFQAFKRLHTKTKYEGSGLGLSICKKIINNHQGRIWIRSQIGTGATFFFTISKHLK